VWGIGQLFTGKMADIYSKKTMLFWGMLLQGIAILLIPLSHSFMAHAALSAILGLGTALVYPTFLSAIAQATNPKQRAESIGTFRLWRDLGYAFGAIISGITADLFGVEYAIFLIGGITVFSSLIIKFRMPATIETIKECIEVAEVKMALQQHKKIKIIDVRSHEEFEHIHIPEATNIVLTDLKKQANVLDKDYQYVTVCGKGGGRSTEGAKLLKELGYKAIWLCGGTTKWMQLN
jgi:rhodanese-related sulfurtransferase